jgi:hypothetical protein
MSLTTRALLAGLVVASASSVAFVSSDGASAAVPGLQLVSAESGNTSIQSKSVTATCPAGKKVLGTGGAILGATPGDVMIADIKPVADLTGVMVVGTEVGLGTPEPWSVKAYAICATPPPGLILVSADTANTSESKGLVLNCPEGKKVLGVGGEISNGETGWIGLQRVRIESATKVRVRGFEIGGTGTTSNWSVTAHAICANPMPGHQVFATASGYNSDNTKSLFQSCPAGKVMVGAGGEVDSPNYMAVLDEIVPVPNLSGVSAISSEATVGTAKPWTARAYAACVTA